MAQSFSEAEIVALLSNPCYVHAFHPSLECAAQSRSEEEWLKANDALIDQIGMHEWAAALLSVCQRGVDRSLSLEQTIVNPADVVAVAPTFSRLTIPQPIPADTWITNAEKLEGEIGRHAYLRNLLAVLRGATLSAGGVPFGFQDPEAPTRSAGPRLGRNDLCWCGSGTKFKRCHGRL